jgi:microcystin degradation protein MlrC
MARIAVGGFQHETNTFAPVKAALEDFVQTDSWPGLTIADAIAGRFDGMNIPVAGFLKQAHASNHQVVGLSWCSASPSAHVTRDAFEHIMQGLIESLHAALPVDAVYLDLHGAMVTEHYHDGDAEILKRVRQVIGPNIPLVASLDLHANVSHAMVDTTDCLIAYRTYPHIDMAKTGARAFDAMVSLLNRGEPFHKAFTQLPFLISLPWQCSDIEPGKSLYEYCNRLADEHGVFLSFNSGFPLADIPDCGPSVMCFGANQQKVEHACQQLSDAVASAESDYAGKLFTPAAAVEAALAATASAASPVIIADIQDNPGAGGHSDTMGLVKALLAQNAPSCVGLIYDPAVAELAHRYKVGDAFHAELGGKSGWPDDTPLSSEFNIEALTDGRFEGTGPYYLGCQFELGPMARLRIGQCHMIVTSKKAQAADQQMFRHLGVEPADQAILGLKSSVHYRADFSPITQTIIHVAAPGPSVADLNKMTFENLRSNIRLPKEGS